MPPPAAATPSPAPAREPDGLYQGDKLVGKAQGARTEAHQLMVFQVMTFTEKLDAAAPIEFKDFLLQCQGISIMASLIAARGSLAVAGGKCKITGKR